jgi:GDPmannose 4,6-dehydratase
MKKAFITGISGMDGSNLSEYLLSLGYEVHGIIRRHSLSESQDKRIQHLPVKTYYGDMLDQSSLENLLQEIQPDEIYNLAAMSHVMVSFDVPQFTCLTNSIGVLNILEAYRKNCPKAKFYQASSSEMFGSSVDEDGFQRETTPMHPVSPYGVSKLFAYHMVNCYSNSYNLNCASGILFNHSGPRRGEAFVEQKICKAAVEIKEGKREFLELGNIYSYRDFGHSKDYVRAMHLILQQNLVSNYVVATGVTKSIEDVVKYVFGELNIDMDRLKVDKKYKRPNELNYLKGDATRIKALGWKPIYTFESMITEMIQAWIK